MTSAEQEWCYQKRPDSVSLAFAIGQIAFVFTPLYWAAWRGPDLLLVLFALWFGSAMHGLLNLMHEAAHFHVFKSRRGSEILAGWFLSPLILTDFESYRKRHWQHHRELGTLRDTKYTYRMDLHPAALLRFTLRCLFLAEALGKFIHVREVDESDRSVSHDEVAGSPNWIRRAALVHSLILLSLVLVARIGQAESWLQALVSAVCAYAVVHLYGLAAITSFVTAIRSVAEHRIGPDDAEVVGFAALRNLETNLFSQLILGCHGFAEHAAHHADTRVPAYHLKRMIPEFAREDPRQEPHHGYLEICWILIREARRDSAA